MRRLPGVALVALCLVTVSAEGAPKAGSATDACAVARRLPSLPADRVSYALDVRLDEGLGRASGSLRVTFRPAVPTDRLVFRLWPNSPAYSRRGARLDVGAVTETARRLTTTRPDPTILVVDREVAAGEQVTVSMPWTLRLPARRGLQLRGARGSARLVSFFPILSWDGSTWATEPGLRRSHGFWTTSPTADFDVRLRLPDGVRAVATGRNLGNGRWRAGDVRDFAVAVGRFETRQVVVRLPRPVRVVVALEGSSPFPIQDFLSETVGSLRSYATRFGPYPWPTHTLVVMADTSGLDGFAYPTLGFVGRESIALIPHETAHQWFYSLVGNNQHRDPWVSEGLTTWAQTGPERSLGTLRATVIPAGVRNRLGEPMSFWDGLGFESMWRGVYVQTAQALASLGRPSTVDCALRLLVTRAAYRTATPKDVLGALTAFFPEAEKTLTAYGVRF